MALAESNNGIAAVGWQQHSQLIQLSKLTLLGRGAILKLNAPLEIKRKGRVVRQAIVDASDIVQQQHTIETLLPNNIDLVCIQVESPSENKAKRGSLDISDAVGLSSPELILADKPLAIVGARHTLLVYNVEGLDYGNNDVGPPFSRIGTTTEAGWRVTGVFGLQGDQKQWAKRFADNSLQSIVENGPLSPAGQTTVQFSIDQGDLS